MSDEKDPMTTPCPQCTATAADIEQAQKAYALAAKVAELQDELLVAKRRLRVLRGSDAMSGATSSGVLAWLTAIAEDVRLTNTGPATRHLKALIETLKGTTP